MSVKSPLGDESSYPATYSPGLLHAIARIEARRLLGLTAELPFRGQDVWNAYELTWLDGNGKPRVATAEFRVPADSPNIIESKSMKLYLNSLSMTSYTEAGDVRTTIANDLTRVAGADVTVRLKSLSDATTLGELPGARIDDNEVSCESTEVDPGLLSCASEGAVSEELHSHLLRSLCPVTGQPDLGKPVDSLQRPTDRSGLPASLRRLLSQSR